MSKKKIWILAEPERFFLPHLVAKLASTSQVAGIIEIHFQDSVAHRIRKIKKVWNTFGLRSCLIIAFASMMTLFLNLFCRKRFFSLSKVARQFKLPYLRCQGFNDPILQQTFRTKIKETPVLVQVGRLVPRSLVENYFLINKHCSLLPRYAGVYPVFWSILFSEPEQGVTIHRMNEKFDDGDILVQEQTRNKGSFFEIYHELYDMTARLFLDLFNSQDNWEQINSGQDNSKYEYFSFPQISDRKKFIRKGGKFGWPLRIHPEIDS